MKAKISIEQELDEDVIVCLVEDGLNTKEQRNAEMEEFLEQSLFEIAEDWVLRGIKPTIEFEE